MEDRLVLSKRFNHQSAFRKSNYMHALSRYLKRSGYSVLTLIKSIAVLAFRDSREREVKRRRPHFTAWCLMLKKVSTAIYRIRHPECRYQKLLGRWFNGWSILAVSEFGKPECSSLNLSNR